MKSAADGAVTVAVADDHVVVRAGILMLLISAYG
jgi:hypothetical protein